MSKTKKNPAILFGAIDLAEAHGYREVTREMIAAKAGVATGTVNLYFGTMHKLRKEIVRHALRTSNNKIIAQAIMAGDPLVGGMDKVQRVAVLTAVA